MADSTKGTGVGGSAPKPSPSPTPASTGKPTSGPKPVPGSGSKTGLKPAGRTKKASARGAQKKVSVKKDSFFLGIVIGALVVFVFSLLFVLALNSGQQDSAADTNQAQQNQGQIQGQEGQEEQASQSQTGRQPAQAQNPAPVVEPGSSNVSTTATSTSASEKAGSGEPEPPLPAPERSSPSPVTTEEAAAFTEQFFGSSGMPTPPTYQNEKEKRQSRVQEEWLVAKMCSQAPAPERSQAAKELGNYPYYRVARALSFVVASDHFAEVRSAAAESLGKVGNVEFLPLLNKSAKEDPDPKVREAAQRAVKKIMARTANLPSGV